MAEIAREYMRRMGITDTQYIVCRHTDKEHQHLHIVANRVDNNGNTISDRNDAVRNVAVCKTLTREYGLHFAKGKEKVKRDRLRGKDKVCLLYTSHFEHTAVGARCSPCDADIAAAVIHVGHLPLRPLGAGLHLHAERAARPGSSVLDGPDLVVHYPPFIFSEILFYI